MKNGNIVFLEATGGLFKLFKDCQYILPGKSSKERMGAAIEAELEEATYQDNKSGHSKLICTERYGPSLYSNSPDIWIYAGIQQHYWPEI